ncbi:MAG: hypothetical protein AAB861_03500 [Patescibacteria group bacterium]
MNREKISYLILRVGLAFSFIYAAVRAYMDPLSWIGWFPPFLQQVLPQDILLLSWGIFEVVIGLWILSGKNIFIPTLLAALSLGGLVFFNSGSMDILFRDVSLALISLGLAISTYRK